MRDRDKAIPRRTFLAGGLAAAGAVAFAPLGPCTPVKKSSSAGTIGLPDDAATLRARITSTRSPLYVSEGRFYLVTYEPGDRRIAKYVDEVVARDGLMALSEKCTHLGCRLPFCTTSGWFECPCHYSYFDGRGEWVGGEASRGMDRFRLSIENGRLVVDTGDITLGPPRDEAYAREAQPSTQNCIAGRTVP